MKRNAKGVTWDLSDYYKSANDLQIQKDKGHITKQVNRFNKIFKDTLKTAKEQKLLDALNKYSEIVEKTTQLVIYSNLQHDKQTDNENLGKFLQEIIEFSAQVTSQTTWFELEIVKIPNSKFSKLIKSNKLRLYKHYLEKVRLSKPFRLSEAEEQILALKKQSGQDAFKRLYNQNTSTTKYRIKLNGKIKELTFSEITPYLSNHHNRNIRKRAAKSISKTQQQRAKENTYILNTLVLDKKIDDNLRKFKYPQQETLLEDELSKEVVDSMITSVSARYDLVERFYKAKKSVLKYKKLYEWDRYSPIFNLPERKYTWKQACDIVLEVFSDFSPVFYDAAKLFIDNNWIDSQVSQSKRSGAYCSLGTPNKHPYILMNFTGEENDIRTLAHELGHGIHACLSRQNNMLEFHPSTPGAEIASVFAEMLLFEKLYRELDDPKQKIELLARKIQESFATIFRQTAFYLFESDVHAQRRNIGELGVEQVCELWQKRLQDSFGSSLTLTPGHKYWWGYVQHFYIWYFYVYSYAFGEALTNALYVQYNESEDEFKTKYIDALKAGGSKSIVALTKTMNLDISQKGFWNRGMSLLEDQVDKFEDLVKNLS